MDAGGAAIAGAVGMLHAGVNTKSEAALTLFVTMLFVTPALETAEVLLSFPFPFVDNYDRLLGCKIWRLHVYDRIRRAAIPSSLILFFPSSSLPQLICCKDAGCAVAVSGPQGNRGTSRCHTATRNQPEQSLCAISLGPST